MWSVCAVAVLLSARVSGSGAPCGADTGVDITSASRVDGDGVLLHEGIHYSADDYYADGNGTVWGCACRAGKASCIRKCCPLGWRRHSAARACEPTAEMFSPELQLESGARVTLHEEQLRLPTQWRLLVGQPTCPPDKLVRTRASFLADHFHLQPDGRLYLKFPHTLRQYSLVTVDQYCLDTFVRNTSEGIRTTFDALVCFAEDYNSYGDSIVSMIGMFISCVFVLLTLAVFAAVPEMRNMHGRVLMAYLSSLFVGFLFLATLNLNLMLNNDQLLNNINVPFTFVIYYALLAAFFWLNVMCFDIWWTFSGYRQVNSGKATVERRRYALYCAYAFGTPAALTALLAGLEFTDEESLPDYVITPRIRQSIFLTADGRLLFLYLPMLLLCLANTAFFVTTALRIAHVRRQTAVLTRGGDSSTTDQFRRDKQRLWLYLKLFALMGLNWVLEVVSAVFPHKIWIITDFYNVIVGFTIFIIFICKKKTLHLIKKRYNLARGISPPRSQTTSTRNTSVSREEIVMPPLHNNNNNHHSHTQAAAALSG